MPNTPTCPVRSMPKSMFMDIQVCEATVLDYYVDEHDSMKDCTFWARNPQWEPPTIHLNVSDSMLPNAIQTPVLPS